MHGAFDYAAPEILLNNRCVTCCCLHTIVWSGVSFTLFAAWSLKLAACQYSYFKVPNTSQCTPYNDSVPHFCLSGCVHLHSMLAEPVTLVCLLPNAAERRHKIPLWAHVVHIRHDPSMLYHPQQKLLEVCSHILQKPWEPSWLVCRCNEKADIYSYGVLLWELIMQEPPRRGDMRDTEVWLSPCQLWHLAASWLDL